MAVGICESLLYHSNRVAQKESHEVGHGGGVVRDGYLAQPEEAASFQYFRSHIQWQ